MTIQTLIDRVAFSIVNPILALLFAVAFLVFLWGVIELIRGAEDQEARKNGRMHMLYGIVGIFIMVSAVGIVYIIQSTVRSL